MSLGRFTSLEYSKNEMGDLVAEAHSIFARWRYHLSQLWNIHGINIRQTGKHTAVPLVPEPSASEVEMGTEKLSRHITPGIHQIPAELIKARGMTICSEIHKLINSVWNKKDLPRQWKESTTVPVYKGDKTHCSSY